MASDETLSSLTGFNFHRGGLALAVRPAAEPIAALERASRVLALEGVTNPDNVGGLFRTAAAFGVDGVLLEPTAGDPLYRKAIRTSMGAALRLPFVRSVRWTGDLEYLRRLGFAMVALTPRPDAEPLARFAARQHAHTRFVLLVGSEGSGLEGATLALADSQVRIPIDAEIDSLNVVVAAGIALDRLCAREQA